MMIAASRGWQKQRYSLDRILGIGLILGEGESKPPLEPIKVVGLHAI